MAFQALSVAADGVDWTPTCRRPQFLRPSQRPTAASPPASSKTTDAGATSAAIQAILALGEKPDDTFWQMGRRDAAHGAPRLLQTNGA